MFIIGMADMKIRVDNKFKYIKGLCDGFVLDDETEADMTVCAEDGEIDEEISVSDHPVSRGYAEAIVVYRKICERLPLEYNGFLFHCALIEYEGRGYAFAAKSGTGKSTHVALWQKRFGDGVRVINGDKPIFRFVDGKLIGYGTPWCGKENLRENDSVPLEAICFLTRAEKNSIKRITAKEAVSFMLTQILRPEDMESFDALLGLLDLTLKEIPCYVLGCNISEEAAEVSYNGMKKE